MLTHARYFFAETTAAFLVALAVWGLTEAGWRRATALVALGLAVLAKPPMVVIGPVLGAVLAIRRRDWRELVAPTAASDSARPPTCSTTGSASTTRPSSAAAIASTSGTTSASTWSRSSASSSSAPERASSGSRRLRSWARSCYGGTAETRRGSSASRARSPCWRSTSASRTGAGTGAEVPRPGDSARLRRGRNGARSPHGRRRRARRARCCDAASDNARVLRAGLRRGAGGGRLPRVRALDTRGEPLVRMWPAMANQLEAAHGSPTSRSTTRRPPPRCSTGPSSGSSRSGGGCCRPSASHGSSASLYLWSRWSSEPGSCGAARIRHRPSLVAPSEQ